MNGSTRVTMDEFVARVVPDPKVQKPLQILSGFIGASPAAGHIRVYADEALNRFVDVPEAAIVHAQSRPLASFPLGGSWLWIERPEERLLEGAIYSDYRENHATDGVFAVVSRQDPCTFPCHTTDPGNQQGCRTNPCTTYECPTKGDCPSVLHLLCVSSECPSAHNCESQDCPTKNAQECTDPDTKTQSADCPSEGAAAPEFNPYRRR
jgi:hypothetical protein